MYKCHGQLRSWMQYRLVWNFLTPKVQSGISKVLSLNLSSLVNVCLKNDHTGILLPHLPNVTNSGLLFLLAILWAVPYLLECLEQVNRMEGWTWTNPGYTWPLPKKSAFIIFQFGKMYVSKLMVVCCLKLASLASAIKRIKGLSKFSCKKFSYM